MCHTRGPILQQIQDVCFLGESLQIAMAVFDVVVFVMQIKYFNVYISKPETHTINITDQKAMNALDFS
jgi:hypothetical protein